MANYKTKDADGSDKYLKSSGAGTDLDPHIVEHLETNSAAIKAALEIIDNAIAGSEMQVDIVSSALPTGASTAANQTTIIGHLDGVETLLTSIESMLNTLDNAISGTEMQVDVLSIIPGTGATNLGKAIDTATGAADVGVLLLATRDDALAALTPIEGDNVQLRVDANGALWTHDDVLEAALSGSELQVDVVGALPAGTNNIGDVDVLSIAAGDNNIGNVDIASAIPAGTNNIGDVDVLTLPAIPAGNNNIGDVDVASIAAGTNLVGDVGIQPRTSGGLDLKRDLDLDETELEIKASAGQLFGWYIYNDGAAEVYVKLYNDTAANVTVGTTTPVLTFAIPAGSAANILSPIGIVFSAGICAAATTEVADAGTTAPAANQVVANFFYK